MFICASSHGERAPGATLEEQAKQLSDRLHLTYVYVGKGLSAPPSISRDTVLAYEDPGNHGTQGMNFLYADGHVEFIGGKDWKKKLEGLKGFRPAATQPATSPATRP